MNQQAFWAILSCAVLMTASVADACSYPEPPKFEKVAPNAKNIFVFRVDRLEYRQSQEGSVRREWVEGTVRVVSTFRGSPTFTKIIYSNSWCGGVRLDVGRTYLIATDLLRDPLRLAPADETVLDISLEFNPIWEPVETSPTLQRLRDALRGVGSFDDVPHEGHYLMTSPIPPTFPP